MKGRSIDELIILKKGGFIVGETDRGLSPHYLGRRPPAVGVEYKGVISEVVDIHTEGVPLTAVSSS